MNNLKEFLEAICERKKSKSLDELYKKLTMEELDWLEDHMMDVMDDFEDDFEDEEEFENEIDDAEEDYFLFNS